MRCERERTSATREELVNSVSRGAALTPDFLLMTALAAIVAAAGLIGDNTAVVIGAMVIAPLLSPNIALALGAALGSARLVLRGAEALAAGMALAVALGYGLAFVLGAAAPTHELMLRTSWGRKARFWRWPRARRRRSPSPAARRWRWWA